MLLRTVTRIRRNRTPPTTYIKTHSNTAHTHTLTKKIEDNLDYMAKSDLNTYRSVLCHLIMQLEQKLWRPIAAIVRQYIFILSNGQNVKKYIQINERITAYGMGAYTQQI